MTPMKQFSHRQRGTPLGKNQLLGSVKPGKYAHLVAVSGDPLAAVSALEHLDF
jgi:imidazolonepropionase-like amidohydrolase